MARKENRALKSKERTQEHFGQPHHPFIAQSPAMQPVLNTIEQVSCTDASILILGENGTGKELVARAIHERSNRGARTFYHCWCRRNNFHLVWVGDVWPREGAFTDAKEARMGKFEFANKGTLFLDEIGNLPAGLAEWNYFRCCRRGRWCASARTSGKELDVRLIWATNAPIYELVKSGAYSPGSFLSHKNDWSPFAAVAWTNGRYSCPGGTLFSIVLQAI